MLARLKNVKGRVQCFSMQMQVVINKCFLLNLEKSFAQIRLTFSRKRFTLISKNDVIEPKARLL